MNFGGEGEGPLLIGLFEYGEGAFGGINGALNEGKDL
jgi:hypothetical protein